jgi:hypothetical protein
MLAKLRQQRELPFLRLHQLDPFSVTNLIELGVQADDLEFRLEIDFVNRAAPPADRGLPGDSDSS